IPDGAKGIHPRPDFRGDQRMSIGSWARSRWVIVPGGMIVFTLAWLAYVTVHNHGIVEGRVVDAAGQPVAGAAVLLFERGFVTHQERGRATTDAQGAFRFTDNRSHSIQLEADAPDLGRTDRRIVRLWFAAEDVQLAEPLRFPAPK
ncbi:MAG: carboxypeptidase-like regulatory domain-containing protein, partial [Acidobacteriota bacterium]